MDYIFDRNHKEYPEDLNLLPKPPIKIYCRGNKELLKRKKVGIVGSRKTSIYGQWLATSLSEKLSRAGVCVVSGMALGIDTFSHVGALKESGGTIAVLGNGLDVCYPSNNWSLKKKIESNGLIISEYDYKSMPKKWTFPQRNRIIAALSDILIIAEAGLNSGAIITAEQAIEMNKEVLVAPTNINNPYGIGSNKLIMEGATPILSIEDVFEKLSLSKIKDEDIENLTNEEREVYNVVKSLAETNFNYIQKTLNIDIKKINVIITILEMKGLVSTSMGRVFIKR